MDNNTDSYFKRPWGKYKILYTDDNFKIKQLIIDSNTSLSLQSHKLREEFWLVIEGESIIEIENKKFNAKAKDHFHIPINFKHRITNISKNKFIIIEIQIGKSFDEDDIIRYEDNYGRVK